MLPLLMSLGLLTELPLAFVGQDVELVYRPSFAKDFKGDRKEAAAQALEVVRKRVGEAGKARRDGDAIVVRATAERARELKPLISRSGTLGLLAVADGRVQDDFNKTGAIPEGYRALKNPNPMPGPEYGMYGEQVLVRVEPIVDNAHVKEAYPRQEISVRGPMWVVAFELTPEGARRFDEAAEALYGSRPHGLIDVVLDGDVHSMPVVQAPSFKGSGQITGAKGEAEARALARVLASGALPVPLELVEERAAER